MAWLCNNHNIYNVRFTTLDLNFLFTQPCRLNPFFPPPYWTLSFSCHHCNFHKVTVVLSVIYNLCTIYLWTYLPNPFSSNFISNFSKYITVYEATTSFNQCIFFIEIDTSTKGRLYLDISSKIAFSFSERERGHCDPLCSIIFFWSYPFMLGLLPHPQPLSYFCFSKRSSIAD